MRILDANILLRWLLQDDPAQTPKVIAFMEKARSGRQAMYVPDAVLLEVVWVLERGYGFDRAKVAEALAPLVLDAALDFDHRARLSRALDFYLDSPLEVVMVGSPGPQLDELRRTLGQTYVPNRVIAICEKNHEQAAAAVPLFAGRNTLATEPTVFVCRANTCQQPVNSVKALRAQLLPLHAHAPLSRP